MRIPLVDLRAQYEAIKADIDTAIAAVIRDAAFIGGRYLAEFEGEFATYCGTRHAVGVGSGTEALRLALHAAGIGLGDEVLTVPNTFIATSGAIRMVGADVRFIDVGADTRNMDPELLESAITPRTRAVIPVHLYGRPAEMDAILEIAKRHDLKVIGDAAQAHGASYGGRKIGTLGDAVCFSFYPGKNLGAYGDAGAVTTDDSRMAERIAMLRDHGRSAKYEHTIEGFSARLDGLQAAILSAKLRHLDEWTARRQQHARRYTEALSGTAGVETPDEDRDGPSVYHLYVIRVQNRARLQERLHERGIQTGVHYPIPLHRQPAYEYLGLGEGKFPVTEQLAREVLSLPMYAELTPEQIDYVVEQVKVAVSGR